MVPRWPSAKCQLRRFLAIPLLICAEFYPSAVRGNISVGFGGGTTVTDSTLLANNSSGGDTGSGRITENNGGTLAGAGAVTGDVTVNGGCTLAPGTSIESLAVGALTVRCLLGAASVGRKFRRPRAAH
jgi:hypothetical protein